ncbi:RWP-RK domain-containing protein [Pelomyxa schiedti]|nr:RWP-RK domain-containing protein [Pelomyxa schiedti]
MTSTPSTPSCTTPPATPPQSQSSSSSCTVTRDDLKKYFHLPIQVVAGELGVCTTMLKQLCRKHGIQRWPHRKIQSLNNAIAQLETTLNKGGIPPVVRNLRLEELAVLHAKKELLLENPNADVDLAHLRSEVRPLDAKRPSPGSEMATQLQFSNATSSISLIANLCPDPPRQVVYVPTPQLPGQNPPSHQEVLTVPPTPASTPYPEVPAPQPKKRKMTKKQIAAEEHNKLLELKSEVEKLNQERNSLARTLQEMSQPDYLRWREMHHQIIQLSNDNQRLIAENTLMSWLLETKRERDSACCATTNEPFTPICTPTPSPSKSRRVPSRTSTPGVVCPDIPTPSRTPSLTPPLTPPSITTQLSQANCSTPITLPPLPFSPQASLESGDNTPNSFSGEDDTTTCGNNNEMLAKWVASFVAASASSNTTTTSQPTRA